MFDYSAICDVPDESLLHLTALLRAHRVCTVRPQVKPALRWFRDAAAMRILGAEVAMPISNSYRNARRHRGRTAAAPCC